MASIIPVSGEPEVPARLSLPRWLAVTCLVGGVVLAYWNSLGAPFLFDDTGAVLQNPTIRRLASLATLSPPTDGSTTTNRPIVNLSYAINYAISGESVWSYHALNVAIHVLAALTLMGIVRRAISGPVGAPPLPADALAFLTALLWALHPLQTESVVCIAQRTESLYGLFYLLTLYTFIRGAESERSGCRSVLAGDPRYASPKVACKQAPTSVDGKPIHAWRWFSLSFLACLLGMGTKEAMVTAPLIVLLYDRTFVAGGFSAAWRRRRVYYAALASTWLLLAWIMLGAGGGRGFGAGFGLGVSWWTYLLKQSEAIVLYLKLSFWPHPLVLDYGTAVVRSVADVWWQGPVVIGLVAGTLWALVRKPVLGFAGAWFFVILAPSSSLMPIVTQTVAEHRMYLPLAAVIASCLVGLHALLKRLPDYATAGQPTTGHRTAVPRSRARLPAILFLALACPLAWLTVSRIRDYRDVVAIWADNVAKCPQVARGHNNLAWAFQQQGNTVQANAHFARAVALEPGYVTARYDWGVALLDQGRVAEAIAQFEAAVQLAPDHADAYVNLGNALMQVQRAVEAIPQYETALRLRPAADAHYDLGVALAEVGRTEDAAGHFRAALQINPALPEAHYQLARLAERAGQPAAAELQYLETMRLAPDHAAAQARLGLLLARAGRLPAAAEHLRAAVRLKPADAEAHVNLGNVLLLQGQAREAVACYEEAVRLRPDDARIRENLQLAREALH
jgi:protein O-mannosyl-transferase